MPYWASPYHMQLASTALIAAMFALSLQILVGAAGLVSLAHAGFFGLGAYTVYLLGGALDFRFAAGGDAARRHAPPPRSDRWRCERADSTS